MDSSDRNLFSQPRRGPSVCRKCNDKRMSDLLVVSGPVKDYFGPGALPLSALGFTALGFAMAWWIDSTQGYHAVMMGALIPLWMLSGAMFPPSGDSHWIGTLMALDPMTYTVSAIRRGFHGDALPAALVPGRRLGDDGPRAARARRAGGADRRRRALPSPGLSAGIPDLRSDFSVFSCHVLSRSRLHVARLIAHKEASMRQRGSFQKLGRMFSGFLSAAAFSVLGGCATSSSPAAAPAAAAPAAPPASFAAQVAEGQTLYGNNCANCHGDAGQGRQGASGGRDQGRRVPARPTGRPQVPQGPLRHRRGRRAVRRWPTCRPARQAA